MPAAQPHLFLCFRTLVPVAARDPDVFPGRPAVSVRLDFQFSNRREVAPAHDFDVRSGEYNSRLGALLPLRYRAPRPRSHTTGYGQALAHDAAGQDSA